MKISYAVLIAGILFLNTYSLYAQTGKWQVLKTKNEAANRSECGLAQVNGKLYLIGGDGGGPQPVESFNPVTLLWTKLATAPVNMHHLQAVPYNNRVYILEAFSKGGFPDQEPLENVYVYDTEKNIWQKGGGLPQGRRRAGAGAAQYKGKLYLVAGIQHGHSSGTTNMFDVYDPVTQTWAQLPDAPNIRDHCSAAVVKDKLYVVGGRNTSFRDPANKITFFSKTMLDVDCYDFLTGKWSVLPAKLPLGSGGGAVVNLNDVLYYIGGERATESERNAPRKNTYFLNLSSNEWKEADTLHFGRNGMAAAVWNNKIYVAGGSGGGPAGAGMPPGKMPPGTMPAGMPFPADSVNYNQSPPGPSSARMGQNKNEKLTVEVFSVR